MSLGPVPAKFRLLQRRVLYPHHRSGWRYATAALEPLLSDDGILLDAFIEQNFGRRFAYARKQKIIPYREPWVGFVHDPPSIPRWHDYRVSSSYIFDLATWRESMRHCCGLATFSRHARDWIQQRVDVPVLALFHPTETPQIKFSFDKFLANRRRSIVQVGFWLRRLLSIYELPVTRLRKKFLFPLRGAQVRQRFPRDLQREISRLGMRQLDIKSVQRVPYLSAVHYDELLSENIVFLHLYNAVANNAIIECIVRNTPVLVNPLPSVIEYLGADYPFYFQTLAEAAAKAQDNLMVKKTHEYLRALPKHMLTGEYFFLSLVQSDLFKSL